MTSDDEILSLNEAAEELGVHYMTAYKYVRTGRLRAAKKGSQWQVRREDLADLAKPASPGRRPAGANRLNYGERLVQPLIEGDEGGAWSVVQGALASGTDLRDLYLGVLSDSMQRIGDQWANGDVSVAEEHRASALMQRMVGRIGPQMRKRGRDRGTVVLGAPPTDNHSLPVSMLVDLLRLENFRVVDLGADVPAESFVEAVEQADPVLAVGISVSAPGNTERIAEVVSALRRATSAPIVVGGVTSSCELAARVGADRHIESGQAAIEWFNAAATRT